MNSTCISIDWTSLPTIKANRISLRRVEDDDVEAIYRIYSNPEVMRYWATPPLANLDAAKELIEEIHEGFQRQLRLKWGVALHNDNSLIGSVTLFNINLNSERAEIGYALDQACWGKGYMHESLQALLGYAFEVVNFRRLEADIDPRNTNSIRTVERLGFKQEGYLRERWHVNGEIQDALFYGLLRREWLKAAEGVKTHER